MCAINGIFVYGNASPVDRDELVCTRDHMASRGPDGRGIWIAGDQRIGFGHRRLSIIDLSEAGAQPMTSTDGRYVVTFNGEIYNYRDLRSRLEARGHTFHTQSDTEVLLHLFSEKGKAMVHDLRGMFAFAIWDTKSGTLFLARDPYGIKPLYVADDGKTIRFASQVKALLAGGQTSGSLDPAGQVGFYVWGSVPEPFTMYRSIRSLPAGASLTIDEHGPKEVQTYFSVAEVYCRAEKNNEDRPSADVACEVIQDALRDSVSHHLVADVPVGAFLSAGVDSGALVGLMRDANASDIQTVTLTFAEFQGRHDDEAPLAADIARRYGTRHTTRVVTAEEFNQDLTNILEAMDQPSIDGINTWFVSKAAHELGLKVVISGLGGDELFGGYPAFSDLPRWARYLAIPSKMPILGRALRWFGETTGLDRIGINPKALSLVEYGGDYPGGYLLRRGIFMPWELSRFMDLETRREGWDRLAPLSRVCAQMTPTPQSTFARVAALESSLYMRNQLLRDADWASMAHSVEVRLPLVDTVVLQQVASVTVSRPPDSAKTWLAQAPRQKLPHGITNRKKTGFGIPVGRWLGQNVGDCSRPATGYSRDWARSVASRFLETSSSQTLVV